ncbi:pollen-specific leucine-rich repeat extensin-like protein 1 [Gouania willdenowi]|uniref:pollen-specific leucine-rich repeat extensin-like protein 1 n=1 Tax=Gouania willdenowi TaxID=441366 RepID=UPI00105662F5|nr:pollen-specific leucine-rich repeat extensin-like protein 1 [Gouania willdenowi]
MVTCHAEGMVVTTEWNIAASRIKVHVNGNWEPLLKASHRCRFSVIEHPEGVVISIHYVPCIDKKDELYTLELSGDGETKITCPSLLVAPPQVRKNLTAPSNPGLGRTSYPTHQQLDASQIPENFLQKPLMQNENPSPTQQNGGRSHLAYYIFHPRFLDSKSLAHDSPPTELSKSSLSTMMPTIQAIQDPRGQMFYHFPFLPPPPESPPTYNLPSDNSGEHFHPPVLPQKSVDVPATIPAGPEQQVAHFLFYHPQQAPHPSPLEVPLPHRQYPEKSPVNPEPRDTFSEMPAVKENTQALQPEAANGPAHHQSYPFYPQQESPIEPTTFLAPQNQAPNGVHYPIKPKAWDQESTFSQPAFPQRQVLQPFQTNVQPVGKSEVEISQGHVRPLLHSSYRKPKPEVQPSETSIVNPRSHKGEHLEVQLHQPTHSYPTLTSENQPKGNSPTRQVQRPCDHSKGTNDRNGIIPTEKLETRRTQQEQTYHPHVPQQPQSPAAYLVIITHQPVPPPFPPVSDPDSPQSPVPVQYVPCSQFCPTGFPNCCPQIAFHQHLHQVFPVFTESKEAPAFYVNPLVLHPVVYSDTGDGLGSPVPLKESEVKTSTTTSPSLPVLYLPLPPGDMQQQYPPEGYPPTWPMNNLSMSENVNMPVFPYFQPDSLYRHWMYSPQHHQYKSQQPFVMSPPLASDPLPLNPIVEQEAQNVPFPKPKHALHHEGATSPDVLLFIDQYLQKQRNKPTAIKQTFNKKPSDLQSLTHLDNQPGHDRFLVPYSMLQDSPVAVDTNNSKLKSPVSDSKKNASKHIQKLDFYSEKKSFAVQQHIPPGSQHLSFNDSLKSFRDIVHDLHKVAQNLGRNHRNATPKDKNSNIAQTQISHSNWLGGENSDPVLGNVHYMPRNDGGAHSPPSNRRQIVIKPQDQLKVEHPESQKDFWQSLLSSGPGQSVPPEVLGKTVQRRNVIAGLNQAPLAEPGSEKHR